MPKAGSYCAIRILNKSYLVHRLSAVVYLDLKLEDTKSLVLHKNEICKSKSCFNPQHLYVGNHKDNTQDLIEIQKGSAFSNSQLTHCHKCGFELSKNNTYTITNSYGNGKSRACKNCRKLAQRAYIARKNQSNNV